MQNSKLNKIRTVLAVILLAFTIFSLFYPVLEAGHDCCGEDCPICYVIQAAENNIKLLTLVFALVFASVHSFNLYKSSKFKAQNVFSNSLTLVSQKIRLND